MKKAKILITGATGNVGKALRACLSKNNYDISCLTNESKRFTDDIVGDLGDYSSLVNATKNIDVVIHLAAIIKGNKKLIQKVNIQGTRNLINACEKNKVKKIIFMSSLDIKFNTPYGKSKLKAEEIIKNSKLKYVFLRPTAIYGEGFKTGVNSLVKLVKKTPVFPIPGSGKNLYQPLYVKDLILLIKQILDKNKFNNKVYFLGGSKIMNLNQLVNLISFNLGKKTIKIHLPIKSKNFKFNKICSNDKIKKDFDFDPLPITKGVQKILC